MAIKGKKKPKGKKRTRPVAPKREVVVPTIPLVSRKGFQVVVAGIVALALGLGLGYGFGAQANQTKTDSEKAIETKAAQKYREAIDAFLPTVGAPNTTGVVPFANLAGALDSLEKDKAVPEAIKTLKSIQHDAKAVIVAWKGIDVPAMTKGLVQPIIDDFEGSQVSLVESLGLYQQAAALGEVAAAADPPQRAEILSAARDLSSSASTMFNQGYQRFTSTMTNAHVTLNSTEIQVPPPGVAPGQPAPGQPVGTAPGQPVGTAPGQPVGTAPGQPVGTAPQQGP